MGVVYNGIGYLKELLIEHELFWIILDKTNLIVTATY